MTHRSRRFSLNQQPPIDRIRCERREQGVLAACRIAAAFHPETGFMLAIIGGSGLTQLSTLEITRGKSSARHTASRPAPSRSAPWPIAKSCFSRATVTATRSRPHQVNYRANIWALKHVKATAVVSVASVGGIRADFAPGTLVAPTQIIDYTWGRKSTYFEGGEEAVRHIDFTHPYDEPLRQRILKAAAVAGEAMFNGGVYAATQGPRLETAAEINRMEGDGADLVGMTGMPEAALARELGLPYAAINVVANYAAGRASSEAGIHFDHIEAVLHEAMIRVRRVLEEVCKA